MENKLREARVIKRISQIKLSSVTGVHSSKISLIENGWLKPRKDEIQRLSEVPE